MSLNRGKSDKKWNNFLTDLTYVGQAPVLTGTSTTSIDASFLPLDPAKIVSVDVSLVDASTYAIVTTNYGVAASPTAFTMLPPGNYKAFIRQNPATGSGYEGQSGPSNLSNTVTLTPPPPVENFITDFVPLGSPFVMQGYGGHAAAYWNSMLSETESFRIQKSNTPGAYPNNWGFEIARFKNDGTVDEIRYYSFDTAQVSYFNDTTFNIDNNRRLIFAGSWQDASYNQLVGYMIFDTYGSGWLGTWQFNGANQMMDARTLPTGGSFLYAITQSNPYNPYTFAVWRIDPLTGSVTHSAFVEFPSASFNGGYGGKLGINYNTEMLSVASLCYDASYTNYLYTANWNPFAGAPYLEQFWTDTAGPYPSVSAITNDAAGNKYLVFNNNGVLKIAKISNIGAVIWQTDFSYPSAYIYNCWISLIHSSGSVVGVTIVTDYNYYNPVTSMNDYFLNVTKLDNSGAPVWSRDIYATNFSNTANYSINSGNQQTGAVFNHYNNEWSIASSITISGTPYQTSFAIDTDTAPVVGLYTLTPNSMNPDHYYYIQNSNLTITWGGTPTLTAGYPGTTIPGAVGQFVVYAGIGPSAFGSTSYNYWNDSF